MRFRYAVILLIYYLLVVLPHEHVGAFLASIFLPGSRLRYNGIMLAVFIAFLFGVGIWVWRKVKPRHRKLLLGYTLLTILLISICINVLFVLNVEAIHFIQYAVFAIICFQITNSYFKTMFWSTVAGVVDELYQYVYLAPQRSEYYDFNDVLINAVGAGIGLIILRAVRNESKHVNFRRLLKSTEFYFSLSVFILLIIGFGTGYISYGPDLTASFCFIKIEQLDFWHEVPPKIKFHVVNPLEGLFFMFMIIGIYSGLQQGSVDISKLSANN